jgi:hypothetical protein
MHNQPIGGEDRTTQALILDQILVLYPETLTLDELVREVSKGSSDYAQQDEVHRAVRELSGAGLLHRVGTLVLPTRAACHFTDIGNRP